MATTKGQEQGRTKADAPEIFKVTSADGRRVYFEGTEDDARTHVENNFPRIHVEPGVNYGDEGPQADAQIVYPNGDTAVYDGANWSDLETE